FTFGQLERGSDAGLLDRLLDRLQRLGHSLRDAVAKRLDALAHRRGEPAILVRAFGLGLRGIVLAVKILRVGFGFAGLLIFGVEDDLDDFGFRLAILALAGLVGLQGAAARAFTDQFTLG